MLLTVQRSNGDHLLEVLVSGLLDDTRSKSHRRQCVDVQTMSDLLQFAEASAWLGCTVYTLPRAPLSPAVVPDTTVPCFFFENFFRVEL